jgi:hypothetical protein
MKPALMVLMGKGKGEAPEKDAAPKPKAEGGSSKDKALGMAFEAASSGNKAAFVKAMKLAMTAEEATEPEED